MQTNDGDIVTNDYDCPMLKASEDMYIANSEDILTDISVIHQCTKKCIFIQLSATSIVEREAIQKSNLVFKHDFTNHTYYLNIYALNYY